MPRSSSRTARIMNAPIQELLSQAKISKDTISLGQGMPFFLPPDEAVNAQIEHIHESYRYTEDAGIESLRNAICEKLLRENGIKCNPKKNIIVTAGGNQAFMNAILSITKPGDEIILIAPYYFNHLMAVQLVDCKAVIANVDADFIPDINELRKKITRKTRAIVTVSPNNPTGVAYPPDIITEINRICAEAGIYHISDEAYEHFLFAGASHLSPASLEHGSTISLFSFSKSFGMAGYRIGYMVFPEHLYSDILKIQDTIGICPPVPSQYAAEAAIRIGGAYPGQFLKKLDDVRKMFIEELGKLNVQISAANGAFYIYVHLPDKRINDWRLSLKLIEKYGVIVIPSSVFGDNVPGFRISYGNVGMERGREGIRRLIVGLRELVQCVR